MTDSILMQLAESIFQHVDRMEAEGRKSNPVIVFSRDGRMKARADRSAFSFFDFRCQEEDIPFMGYPTQVDLEQSEDYIVREQQ